MAESWTVQQKAAFAAALTSPSEYEQLRRKYPNSLDDLEQLRRVLISMQKVEKFGLARETVVDDFERVAQKQPDHPCVLYQDEVYSYAEVSRNAAKTARWIRGSDPGLKKGDAVCVLLHNGPTFLWTWLGLMKIGVISSLLNYNLRGATLLHCIRASEVKKVMFGSEFLPVMSDILPDLRTMGIHLWMVNDTAIDKLSPPPDVVTMDISTVSGDPFPSTPIDSLADTASYIFTSGTTGGQFTALPEQVVTDGCYLFVTGMPKPAVVSHGKLWGSFLFPDILSTSLTQDDVFYVALPLYHSAALMIAVCGSWHKGATVAIARKFSASRFWDDIRKYKATFFQYIGEICRYLLAQPRRENDGMYERPLRAVIGNGLRVEIWQEFQKRFNIGQIHEFYGATDGTQGFLNVDGCLGTVGKYPWTVRKFFDSVEIVAYDFATSEPRRGPDGLCILLPVGTPGLLFTKIFAARPFTGYKGNRELTERKIVRNVKVKGDEYFNTGDVMMIDKEGYVYFKDRVGDTFRWKGENVSTFEVSHVLGSFPAIEEANVYGVHIPGHEGRAGMAAIVIQSGHKLNYHQLYRHVTSSLPGYACPKFLRLVAETDLTSTLKQKKTELVKRGFAPDHDQVFIIEPSQETYVPITENHIRGFLTGQSKL